MVTIRLRTSDKAHRIQLPDADSISLDELMTAISSQTGIQRELLQLSWDMAGNNPLDEGQQDLQCRIKLASGDLIYLVGRLEAKVVPKSFVGGNGETVLAGVTFEGTAPKALQAKNGRDRSDVPHSAKTVDSKVGSSTEELRAMKETIPSAVNDSDEFIRSPDPVKNMRLLGNSPDPFDVNLLSPGTVSDILLQADGRMAQRLAESAQLNDLLQFTKPPPKQEKRYMRETTSSVQRSDFGVTRGPMRALNPATASRTSQPIDLTTETVPSSATASRSEANGFSRQQESHSDLAAEMKQLGLSDDEIAQQFHLLEMYERGKEVDLTSQVSHSSVGGEVDGILELDPDMALAVKLSLEGADDPHILADELLASRLQQEENDRNTQLQQQRSWESDRSPRAPLRDVTSQHVVPCYDEDDELYARALQESLNEQ